MKVAINGFGRIGKQFLAAALEQKVPWQFVINDLADTETIRYTLKYDSVHPSFKNVQKVKGGIKINGKLIPLYREPDFTKLPWKKHAIDVVVDCTGLTTKDKSAHIHQKAGAKKVLISAPATYKDVTIVQGVNTKDLKKSHEIISAGSCTTNCLAILVKIINDTYGIENAHFCTTHAYTATQRLTDSHNEKDPRKGRAAAVNIIPSSSGASISVEEAVPEIRGKLTGFSLRVPVINGSFVTLYAAIKKGTTQNNINKTFKNAAQRLKGVLEYTEDPIVSSDVIHNKHSCIFDAKLTKVTGNLISVSGWYDNEWGYANRLVDIVRSLKK